MRIFENLPTVETVLLALQRVFFRFPFGAPAGDGIDDDLSLGPEGHHRRGDRRGAVRVGALDRSGLCVVDADQIPRRLCAAICRGPVRHPDGLRAEECPLSEAGVPSLPVLRQRQDRRSHVPVDGRCGGVSLFPFLRLRPVPQFSPAAGIRAGGDGLPPSAARGGHASGDALSFRHRLPVRPEGASRLSGGSKVFCACSPPRCRKTSAACTR